MWNGKRGGRRTTGFTYLGLLILIAVLGLVGAAGVKMGALMQRRAAEQALLEIGTEFADALKSYAAATPRGQPRQPPSISELLRDPRFPAVRRHLRQLPVDPISGSAEWGITYADGETGVLGLYSLSEAQPLKVGNFEPWLQQFEGRSAYRQWEFTAAQARTDGEGAGPIDDRGLISPMNLLDETDMPPAAGKRSSTETGSPGPGLISPLNQ